MNEKLMSLGAMFAVIALGVVSILGMSLSETGQAMRPRESRTCSCLIEHLNYYGNPVIEQTQYIRARNPTPESCQHRCEMFFGWKNRNVKTIVIGESTDETDAYAVNDAVEVE